MQTMPAAVRAAILPINGNNPAKVKVSYGAPEGHFGYTRKYSMRTWKFDQRIMVKGAVSPA